MNLDYVPKESCSLLAYNLFSLFREEHGGVCFEWEFVPQGKLLYILDGDNVRHGLNCTLVLKQNIVQRTFEGLEPLVKKMGPNSKLHFSSLKIRRKHFLSSIFQHLREKVRERKKSNRELDSGYKVEGCG
ncbi:uncharacterized protein LOC126582747 [Malus sylvestris]|uniref:uncharacterized protein LOC126582747 n=1 Tax=Malus sylvestris TaxID=3752 RepID=UPI0021AD0BC6|nr:uncharacterized protein LOC126582747 [Malus sylvestris]